MIIVDKFIFIDSLCLDQAFSAEMAKCGCGVYITTWMSHLSDTRNDQNFQKWTSFFIGMTQNK